MITGDHVRMIRGAMRLSVRQFAELAGISKMTVSEMERGLRRTYEATSDKIREAFAPYVEFIEPLEGIRGAGIVMKWGVEPIGDANDNQNGEASSKSTDVLQSHAWDEDFKDPVEITELSDDERSWLNYVHTNPNLSERGREILLKTVRP